MLAILVRCKKRHIVHDREGFRGPGVVQDRIELPRDTFFIPFQQEDEQNLQIAKDNFASEMVSIKDRNYSRSGIHNKKSENDDSP